MESGTSLSQSSTAVVALRSPFSIGEVAEGKAWPQLLSRALGDGTVPDPLSWAGDQTWVSIGHWPTQWRQILSVRGPRDPQLDRSHLCPGHHFASPFLFPFWLYDEGGVAHADQAMGPAISACRDPGGSGGRGRGLGPSCHRRRPHRRVGCGKCPSNRRSRPPRHRHGHPGRSQSGVSFVRGRGAAGDHDASSHCRGRPRRGRH